ncbi:hypothetical protein LGQ03_05695 [Loktanella sp. TSTF-M6]|uniref:DUF560 domain-containing protein n=1 Tax=Loktanella gaetbuli TaxID=2881335 RepID=A0ABS8BSX3_9RHOB|nr:hypothetical protein [Loktanella gaetbuli]MCB5198727.1 hypothetical protein [Loktanella gaetbuli]
MTRLSQCLSALAVVAALQTNAAHAQNVELTADETRALAIELANAGDLAASQSVLDALLARDDRDVTALITAARIATAQNRPADAVALGARAYSASTTDVEAYVAARIVARAHVEQNNDSRAQFWLRRARQYAPDAETAEGVAEDYAFVRNRNPLSLDLSFGIRPSSNINNGSQSREAFLLGLPFALTLSRDAQALSGLAYNLGATARYRLRDSETSATFFDVSIDGTTYTLSQDAKDDLEAEARLEDATGDTPSAEALRDIKGSDYAFVQLSFGLTHRVRLAPDLLPTTLSARIGTSWYGGAPYQDFVDANVGQSLATSDRSRLRLLAGVQKQIAEDSFDDVMSYRFGARYSYVLDRGDLVTFSIDDRISVSDNVERDYTAIRAGVDYDLSEPVYGVRLGFGLSVENRAYDFSRLNAGPRDDLTVDARATAQFSQVEYYGFQPVGTLEISKTSSDNALFDREYISLGFDLRSAF